MKKWMKGLFTGTALTLSLSFTAFAGQWHEDMAGRWYENDDGSYPVNGWHWIDENADGLAECYYFNQKGYAITANGVAEGYNVNQDGAWIVDGVVQTKEVEIPNDPEALAVYEEAVAKNAALDSSDFTGTMVMTMSVDSEPTDILAMGLNFDMKMRGAAEGDLQYIMSGSMTVDGEEILPFSVFYVDGYMYMDMLGMKAKEEMPFEEAMETAKELQAAMGDTATTGVGNLKMKEENGKKILTYNVNAAQMNNLMEMMMGSSAADLTDMGIDYNYRINEGRGEVVVDENGYYTSESVYMDMSMDMTDNGESETLNVTIDIKMDVNNPGQPANFTLPSTDGYVSANA